MIGDVVTDIRLTFISNAFPYLVWYRTPQIPWWCPNRQSYIGCIIDLQ